MEPDYLVRISDGLRAVRIEMLRNAPTRGRVPNRETVRFAEFPARNPRERIKARSRAGVMAAQWVATAPGSAEIEI